MAELYVNLYGASGNVSVSADTLIEVLGVEDASDILAQNSMTFKFLHTGGFITLYASTIETPPPLLTSASSLRIYLDNELTRQKVFRSSAESSTRSLEAGPLIPILPDGEKLGPLDVYYED